MYTLVVSLLLAATATVSPCADDAHHQFDFWVGEWSVTLRNGKPAGSNHISKIAGGCALLEEWTGASGTTGKSLNTYDATRGVWHQTWVDSDGGLLIIEGRLTSGAMQMGNVTDRITWTPMPDGDVRQLWEQSTDSGTAWKSFFDGRYHRVKK